MAQIDTRAFEGVMAQLGLTPRPQQEKLVALARQIVDNDETGFVQAGTGVGKSFAVLSVAYEARKITDRVSMVVAPTNRLIDQYVINDAPRVAKATGARIEYLKGRRNYICAESYGFETKFGRTAPAEFLKLIETGRFEWVQHYGFDETYGCDGNCENTENICGVQQARMRAAGADIIVTNGHMLTYDQLIREWTFGKARLLPEYGALFVDECHELDAVIRSCLSDEIGPKSKIYDMIPGLHKWVMSQITEAALGDRNRELAVPTLTDPVLAEMAGLADRKRRGIVRELDEAKALGDASIAKSLKKDLKALERFISFAGESDVDSRFISSITVEPDEFYPGGLRPRLNRVCIDAALTARPILQEQPSVLVSGTIPPSLLKRLGVHGSDLDDVGTPFDYSKSQLAVSEFSPKNRDHDQPRLSELKGAVLDKALKSHEDGGGGTLVLVTSWADLDTIAQFLVQNLPPEVPVLTQHRTDASDTAEMLEYFADHGHAVLIGVRSLWTGVDIPGPALRQVVIWKLPYAVPTIEVKAIQERHGRQVYYDDTSQLLAQGIGRLVRTTEDDGRILISDSRARSTAWSANPMTRHISGFERIGRR